MAIPPQKGKLIYHLTHLSNLKGILTNGLLPRKMLDDFVDVASSDILESREKYQLEDYVPFHFFAGTPFCGSVQYNFEQEDFIYLAMTREAAKNSGFKIIPLHPLSYDGQLLDWDDGINCINWELMAQRDYSDHDCKEVCMAEALFRGPVEIAKIDYIYVGTNEVRERVHGLLKEHNFNELQINLNPYMFRQ